MLACPDPMRKRVVARALVNTEPRNLRSASHAPSGRNKEAAEEETKQRETRETPTQRKERRTSSAGEKTNQQDKYLNSWKKHRETNKKRQM